MNILVVEDEALITDFLRRGLEAEGYAVDTAARGEDALACLCAPPDLVILEAMLPGMDGFEVLGAIRASDPDLPVIMLTARGEVADRVRGLDLGATDYLGKPFAFAELLARIRADPESGAERKARVVALRRARDARPPGRRPSSTAAASSSRPASSRCSRTSCGIRARCCRASRS